MNRQFSFRRMTLCLLCVAILIVPQTLNAFTIEEDRVKQVKAFVDAFNARDLNMMLDFVDDNIQWMSIDGAKISIEVEGKAPLRKYMEGYYQSCKSCRSELVSVQMIGSRVTAMERASWTGKDGPRSQKSMSVYEFRNGKIFRVYYFPIEHD